MPKIWTSRLPWDHASACSEDWEMASAQKKPFEVYYGKEEDIALFMAQAAKWNEAMGVATKEAMAPIGQRVNAAGDLVKNYSA